MPPPKDELVLCTHCNQFVTSRTFRRHRARQIQLLVGHRPEVGHYLQYHARLQPKALVLNSCH